MTDRNSWNIKARTKSHGPRPWYPGPPPPRLRKEFATKLTSEALAQNARIPVRKVVPLADLSNPCLQKYLRQPLDLSPLDANKRVYFFHATTTCGQDGTVSKIIPQSFASTGPRIDFARPCSYFSPTPAVYYTTSFEFALAWTIFTQTGSWTSDWDFDAPDLRSVIYVSEVTIGDLFEKLGEGFNVLCPPTNQEEEQLLEDVGSDSQ